MRATVLLCVGAFLSARTAAAFDAAAAPPAAIEALDAVRITVARLPAVYQAPIARFLDDPSMTLLQLNGELRALPRRGRPAGMADLGAASTISGADDELRAHRLFELNLGLIGHLEEPQRRPLVAVARIANGRLLGEAKSRALERKVNTMAQLIGYGRRREPIPEPARRAAFHPAAVLSSVARLARSTRARLRPIRRVVGSP